MPHERVQMLRFAGLLHDIGKLVLPLAFGEQAVDELARAHPAGTPRVMAERERLGVDHAYAGALLSDQEGARGELFQTISFHHGGLPGPECPTREIACVQLANVVVGMLAGEQVDQELVHVALQRLGATPAILDAVAEAALPRQRGGPDSVAAGDGLAARIASLERLASTDELTGLANRREWLARTRTRLAGSEEGAVVVCDVDRFKQINDKVGHLTADLVLTEIARVLARHGDAGRLGGDEFSLWIACDADADTAQRAADAIVEEVAARLPGDGELPSVSVSLGVALTTDRGRELTNLLEAADTALYTAKEAGRACASLAG
jgi:diguanylate cyclase (GGDEF)-like protein